MVFAGRSFDVDRLVSCSVMKTAPRVARWFGDTTPAGDLAVSPDGTKVAYTVSIPPSSGSLRLARTIYVQPLDSGRPHDVTRWNSVGWSGRGMQALPRHIDPHWLDATHLEYTDDLDSEDPTNCRASSLCSEGTAARW